jgi:hypothetical protein
MRNSAMGRSTVGVNSTLGGGAGGAAAPVVDRDERATQLAEGLDREAAAAAKDIRRLEALQQRLMAEEEVIKAKLTELHGH